MKKCFNKKLFAFVLSLFLLLLPVIFVFAQQENTGGTTVTVINPIPTVKTVNGLIKKILESLLKIGIPIVALAIIYCGFLFVSARGRPKEIETARRSLIYTLVGAALLLGAWAIAQLLSDTVIELGK